MAKSRARKASGSAQLDAFLVDHARYCARSVETWMLRSLPVPRAVLAAVMRDPAWAAVLRDAWIVPVGADGTIDREAGGLYRGVDRARGLGVVDRDGESVWFQHELVLVPHPVLLDELDDLRGLAIEAGATQGLPQLFRETFVRPSTAPDDPEAITSFSGGEFALAVQAFALAKQLGYRVSAGNAVCRVLEDGRFVEARFELGDGDPMSESQTGSLRWVDDRQRPLAVVDVPPIAFSEGMRMASLIHAGRRVEGASDDAA
jgi:hypothetical protein